MFPMRDLIQPLVLLLRSSFSSKKGQTLVEYALITAVVSIVAVAVFNLLGAKIVIIFSAVTMLLDTAQSSH